MRRDRDRDREEEEEEEEGRGIFGYCLRSIVTG